MQVNNVPFFLTEILVEIVEVLPKSFISAPPSSQRRILRETHFPRALRRIAMYVVDNMDVLVVLGDDDIGGSYPQYRDENS